MQLLHLQSQLKFPHSYFVSLLSQVVILVHHDFLHSISVIYYHFRLEVLSRGFIHLPHLVEMDLLILEVRYGVMINSTICEDIHVCPSLLLPCRNSFLNMM